MSNFSSQSKCLGMILLILCFLVCKIRGCETQRPKSSTYISSKTSGVIKSLEDSRNRETEL